MNRYYVAYGSNLNLMQMEFRCPDAEIIRNGYLNNWELNFKGSKTGSYATIDRSHGKKVPVVVWSISERDERNLDRYEGYPTFYKKQNVVVNMDDGSKMKAMVYIMQRSTHGVPSMRYIDTVYQGYIDNGLDVHVLENALGRNLILCRHSKVFK